MTISGGVAPVGSFVLSVAGKGGLRNNTETLCALYLVSLHLGKLAQNNRKGVDVDMDAVETQNIHHHRSLLLPFRVTPASLPPGNHWAVCPPCFLLPFQEC